MTASYFDVYCFLQLVALKRADWILIVVGQWIRCGDIRQGRREFPFGNSRESTTPKIPGGNYRELRSSRREFLGVYKISNFGYFLL